MESQKPKLVGLEGPVACVTLEVPAIAVIGREKERELHIGDDALSRSHAQLELSPNGYVISDLGSQNGTFVNGERLAGARPLLHGDVITVGRCKLRFDLPPTPSSTEEPAEVPSVKKKTKAPKEGNRKVFLIRVFACFLVVIILLLVAAKFMGGKGGEAQEKPSETTTVDQEPVQQPTATAIPLVDASEHEELEPADDLGNDVNDLLRRADQLYEEREIAFGSCWMAIARYEKALTLLRKAGEEDRVHQTVAKLERARVWLDEQYGTRKKRIDRSIKQAQNLRSGPEFEALVNESFRLANEITELIPDRMDERHSYGRKRKMVLGRYASR